MGLHRSNPARRSPVLAGARRSKGGETGPSLLASSPPPYRGGRRRADPLREIGQQKGRLRPASTGSRPAEPAPTSPSTCPWGKGTSAETFGKSRLSSMTLQRDVQPTAETADPRDAPQVQAPARSGRPDAAGAQARTPFVCRSPRCGCRQHRARSAHARRSVPRSMAWEARIWRALRRRPATQAQLTERLARTRLPGFGRRPIDPALLAAVDHLLHVTNEIRWSPLVGRQRVKRLEVL